VTGGGCCSLVPFRVGGDRRWDGLSGSYTGGR
jgi:hypothetical protein